LKRFCAGISSISRIFALRLSIFCSLKLLLHTDHFQISATVLAGVLRRLLFFRRQGRFLLLFSLIFEFFGHGVRSKSLCEVQSLPPNYLRYYGFSRGSLSTFLADEATGFWSGAISFSTLFQSWPSIPCPWSITPRSWPWNKLSWTATDCFHFVRTYT
jgi:hypothetical protein